MTSVDEFLREYFKDSPARAEFCLRIWGSYRSSGLADSHFENEITSGDEGRLWQRMWEMVFYDHLRNHGHKPTSDDEGPDFCFKLLHKLVYVECIVPEPTGIPSKWFAPTPPSGGWIVQVPSEEILLRYTSALKEKQEKLVGRVDRKTGIWRPGYLANSIVGANDAYVIAVDARRLLGDGNINEGPSRMPYALEAALAVGPWVYEVSPEGRLNPSAKRFARYSVKNQNQADVPTDSFLNHDYAGVSALIGCTTQNVHSEKLSMAVVHNPFARNPIPPKTFGPFSTDYVPVEVEDEVYEIRTID
jgi:type I restriction enzyme S subunit